MDLLVLQRLVAELEPRIRGARIDQVYAVPNDHLALVVSRRAAPRLWFSAEPDQPHLYERAGKHPTPKTPPPFAMAARKLLSGRHVTALELVGADRVVELRCAGDEAPRIVFELIPRRATAILIDHRNVVRAAWKPRRGRPGPGDEYAAPAADTRPQPAALSAADWAALEIAPDDEGLARNLLRSLRGMSLLLAREIVVRHRSTGVGLADATAAEIERAATEAVAARVYAPAPLDELVGLPAAKDFLVAPYRLRHMAGDKAATLPPDADPPGAGEEAATDGRPVGALVETEFASLREAADAYYPRRAELAAMSKARGELDTALGVAIAKLHRRLDAVAADIARWSDPEAQRRYGDLLLAHPEATREGGFAILPNDYGAGEPLRIAIDPAAPLTDSAQRYYQKARRADRSRRHTAARERLLRARMSELEQLRIALEEARDLATYRALVRAAQRHGAAPRSGETVTEAPEGRSPASARVHAGAPALGLSESRSGLPEAASPRRPPDHAAQSTANVASPGAEGTVDRGQARRIAAGVDAYTSPGGSEILVGRNATANERLTHKIATPHDFWLHADGPGSHVVIRNPTRRERPTDDALRDAAALAAYFSFARGATKVNVRWTQARHVRKPRRGPKGQVIVRQAETVLAVPMSPEELFGTDDA